MDEESRLNAIEDQIRVHGDAISEFKSKIDVRFDELKSKIDRFDELDQKFGGLAQQFDVLIAQIQSLLKVKGYVAADLDIQRGSSSSFPNQVPLEVEAHHMFDEMPKSMSSSIVENQQVLVEVDGENTNNIGGENPLLSFDPELKCDSSINLEEVNIQNPGNYSLLEDGIYLVVRDAYHSTFESKSANEIEIMSINHGNISFEKNERLLKALDNVGILEGHVCSIVNISNARGVVYKHRIDRRLLSGQFYGYLVLAYSTFDDGFTFLFDPGGYLDMDVNFILHFVFNMRTGLIPVEREFEDEIAATNFGYKLMVIVMCTMFMFMLFILLGQINGYHRSLQDCVIDNIGSMSYNLDLHLLLQEKHNAHIRLSTVFGYVGDGSALYFLLYLMVLGLWCKSWKSRKENSDSSSMIKFGLVDLVVLLNSGNNAKLGIQIELDKEKKNLSPRHRALWMKTEGLIRSLGATNGFSVFIDTIHTSRALNLVGQIRVWLYRLNLVAYDAEVISHRNRNKRHYLDLKGHESIFLTKEVWIETRGQGTETTYHITNRESIEGEVKNNSDDEKKERTDVVIWKFVAAAALILLLFILSLKRKAGKLAQNRESTWVESCNPMKTPIRITDEYIETHKGFEFSFFSVDCERFGVQEILQPGVVLHTRRLSISNVCKVRLKDTSIIAVKRLLKGQKSWWDFPIEVFRKLQLMK